MRILGLDYGDKTVGVAITDELGFTAQPVTTVVRERSSKLRKTYQELEKIIEQYSVALTGNTLESTFTTTNMHDKEWWEKIILTVKGYEEVVNTQYNHTDRYLTVEGVMTSNYDGVATNTDRIDTLGVISGRLSQRVRQ